MADHNFSISKPLNPMASPYTKLPSSNHFYILNYHHHHSPPLLPFYTYNVRLQPPSPPSPLPDFQKEIRFSLTPVPLGPRVTKFQCSVRCRRVENGRRGDGGGEFKWRPKIDSKSEKLDLGLDLDLDLGGKKNKKVVESKKRWKNKRGEYQRNLPLESETTTVMIRNIPNKYTRKLLIQTLDNHCKIENSKIQNDSVSAYDFLYLPIDFNHRANAGFAFVNFTTPEAALRFRDEFHGKRWPLFDSPKVAEISKARIQGKEALISNCKVMNFSYGSEEDLPVWFDPARDGSGRVVSKMRKVGKFHGYLASY